MIAAVLTAWAAVALIRDQDDDFSMFDTIGPWQIVRRVDGCFMITAESDAGTVPNVYYRVTTPDRAVNLLFINRGWSFKAGPVEGFRIAFAPSGRRWDDLDAIAFTGGDGAGIVGMAFGSQAADTILTDLASADSVELSQEERVFDRMEVRDSGQALARLLACARTFPEHNMPTYSFESGVPRAPSD